MKAALAMTPKLAPMVFGAVERARLSALVDIDWDRPAICSPAELADPQLRDVELLLTGWGVPPIGAAELELLPRLAAVVHWGGGVGFLDEASVRHGVAVSTGRAANAIPVAEFTVAMIVLAAKDAFWVSRDYSRRQEFIDREDELVDTGLYETTVGIVGASSIGTLVMDMLKAYDTEVLLHHPRASAQRAAAHGAELVADLVQVASRSRILSVHAPDLPELRHMISREVLAALPDGATVINTSRGRLIDQEALVAELQSGRIRAILDVTDPDVLPKGHALYTLPNVFLTPHLAGSMGVELRRLGKAAVDEVELFVQGSPFAHPIVPGNGA